MASAQSCMDSATTAAQANACAAKVEGIETPSAYLIRCSANFIAQGFTGERIAKAYQRMTESSGSSGSDPMLSMMSYLVFSNNDSTNTIAATLSNCTKSGTISMLRLAEVANLASTVASVGSINPADFDPSKSPEDLQIAIEAAVTGALAATPAQQEALGTVALQMNASVCSAGSSLADKEVCTYMADAIQHGGSATGVAQYLLNLLKDKF